MIKDELIDDLFRLILNAGKIKDDEIRLEFLKVALVTLRTYLEGNRVIKSGAQKLLKECFRWGIRSNEVVLTKEQQERLKEYLV